MYAGSIPASASRMRREKSPESFGAFSFVPRALHRPWGEMFVTAVPAVLTALLSLIARLLLGLRHLAQLIASVILLTWADRLVAQVSSLIFPWRPEMHGWRLATGTLFFAVGIGLERWPRQAAYACPGGAGIRLSALGCVAVTATWSISNASSA